MSTEKNKFECKRYASKLQDLLNMSWYFLRRAEKEEEGSFYDIKASLIFTAFAFESFLNEAGKNLIPSWYSIERKFPWGDKLKRICTEELKIDPLEYKSWVSTRPFLTLKRLFKYRDNTAHSKFEFIKKNKIKSLKCFFKKVMKENLYTEDERYSTYKNAEETYQDVKEVIKIIIDKAGFDYSFGRDVRSYEMQKFKLNTD